jgi:hypothetical protein
MTSTLRVNKINTTDNSSVNLISGIAKHWVNINGSAATPVNKESLNSSSVTDVATGRYTSNITSNFTNANFSGVSSSNGEWNGVRHCINYLGDGGAGFGNPAVYAAQSSSTQGCIISAPHDGGQRDDTYSVRFANYGDLA